MPFHRHLYWVFVVLAAGSLSGCKTSLAATTPQGAQAPSGEVLLTPQQVRETRIEIQTAVAEFSWSNLISRNSAKWFRRLSVEEVGEDLLETLTRAA